MVVSPDECEVHTPYLASSRPRAPLLRRRSGDAAARLRRADPEHAAEHERLGGGGDRAPRLCQVGVGAADAERAM
eukprot:4770989-Pleurochrysis_carterae.AAC.1